MTRTEYIERLRNALGGDLGNGAADMLEADERIEAAFNEWHSKTEWVQETAKPKELGMHRADVLKQRIDELQAAARLALDALNLAASLEEWPVREEYKEAIAALKEVL